MTLSIRRLLFGAVLLGCICGACRSGPAIAEHILDARRPNTTSSRFLQPADGNAAPSSGQATLLLFVHGIFGDTVDTWKRASGKSLPRIVLDRPEFAGRFDAFAFGFPSSMVKQGSFSTPEAAKALESDLRFHRLLAKYQQIVIVAHSMGGLVALEALTTYPDLRAKVPLVVTFGTPYDGAQITKLGKDVLANPAILDMQARDGGNGFLQSLGNRWKEAKRKGAQTTVTCAYEKIGLPLLGMVVAETSATALCDGVADAIPDDHILMIKPDKDDHASVKVLTNALQALLAEQDAAWSALIPLPGQLPAALENSEIGASLLGQTSSIGPSARAQIEQRRKELKYVPAEVDRFLYLSPRFPAATPRQLQLLNGLDASMQVIAVDDSGPVANILNNSKTTTSSFQWAGDKALTSVRFVVLMFPLSRDAARQIKTSTEINDLVRVK